MSQKRKPPLYQVVCKSDNLVYFQSTKKVDCVDLLQIAYFKLQRPSSDFIIRRINSYKKNKRIYYEDCETIR